MINICLIGYGKMGKMLQAMAPDYGCRVVSIIEPGSTEHHTEIDIVSTAKADVCIDFSHPSVVMENIRKLLALHKSVVVGTTGWNAHLQEVKSLVEAAPVGFLYGANFSLGMNLFGRIAEYATQIFDKFERYDIYGLEMHHNQKADSPSGTAIELAQRVLNNSTRKQSAVYQMLDRKPQADELHFASVRGGYFPGTHKIGFDSEADTVELLHQVRSRSTFAAGALQAAKWLKGKRGFYSFNEMVEDILC